MSSGACEEAGGASAKGELRGRVDVRVDEQIDLKNAVSGSAIRDAFSLLDAPSLDF